MKKVLAAVIFATAFSASTVFAADMPVKGAVYKSPPAPMFNWSGFYLGAYAGWMRGDSRDVSGGGPEVRLDGGAFGGLAGVNWQTGNFVWGFEGDGGWSTADHGPDNWNFTHFEDRFIGNARVRAGLAYDRTLFYIAGGAAFTNEEVTHSGGPPSTVSKTRTGWTIGGGVDWAATDNFILRVEYLYAGFGEKNYPFFGGGDTHRVDYDNQHTVRAAAIWKFGSLNY